MHFYAFFNHDHQAWLAATDDDMTMQSLAMTSLSLDTLLNIMRYCSPLDLVAMRGTCKTFQSALDNAPIAWCIARENLHNAPPPPSPMCSEWAWATRMFTDALERVHELPLEWQASYTAEWMLAHASILTSLEKYVREDGKRNAPAAAMKRAVQWYMRSPTCLALVLAHRRDLKPLNASAWKAALPWIHRDLALLATCDPARVPYGFPYYENDRVLCPACHPDPAAARVHADDLPNWSMKREWFDNNVVIVDVLYEHYFEKHNMLLTTGGLNVIPRLDIYTRCAACLRRPWQGRPRSSEVLTYSGMVNHNRRFHGVVNPGLRDRWYSSIEIVGGPSHKRVQRAPHFPA
ncbi:hypothetical protein EV122DRAFT_283608 [Schizophyllum commune]